MSYSARSAEVIFTPINVVPTKNEFVQLAKNHFGTTADILEFKNRADFEESMQRHGLPEVIKKTLRPIF